MAKGTDSIIEEMGKEFLMEAVARIHLGEENPTSSMIEQIEERGQQRLVATRSQLPQEGAIKTRGAMFIYPIHPDEINRQHEQQEESKARILANGGDLSKFCWYSDDFYPPGSDAYDDALNAHLMAAVRAEQESAALRRKVEQGTGIVFGDEVDQLFVRCILPEGWRLEPTEHAMWSSLLDAQGRKRAAIFYKAAAYDLKAFIRWEPRYVEWDFRGSYPKEDKEGDFFTSWHITPTVRDNATGTIVHAGNSCLNPHQSDIDRDEYRRRTPALERESERVKTWLYQQYPDAQNPFAYWND